MAETVATEAFRSGMCIFTSRAIDAMKGGKPGDKITRAQMTAAIGRSVENGTNGQGNVRQAISHCKSGGVYWQWSRAAQAYVCLEPSQIVEETERGVRSVHRKTGRVLKGAACVRVENLKPEEKRQFDLSTTRLAMARTATSTALKKRLESVDTIKPPTLEDLSAAFTK